MSDVPCEDRSIVVGRDQNLLRSEKPGRDVIRLMMESAVERAGYVYCDFVGLRRQYQVRFSRKRLLLHALGLIHEDSVLVRREVELREDM